MVFNTLGHGGTASFTVEADMSTLFDDIRLVRPTDLLIFPRVLDMIHQHYQSEVVRRMRGDSDVDAVRTQVMEEMRNTYLGDRLALVTVASAPTTPEVKRFMKDCFRSPSSTATARPRVAGPC